MTTKTWVIEQMTAYPQAHGQADVVFLVAWRLNGVDGAYNATCYGTVGVTYVAGSPYTPYYDLTEAQVIGWVKTALGAEQVAGYEASIDSQIASQIYPTIVNPNLPWTEA
jgi:hypothetical protein